MKYILIVESNTYKKIPYYYISFSLSFFSLAHLLSPVVNCIYIYIYIELSRYTFNNKVK